MGTGGETVVNKGGNRYSSTVVAVKLKLPIYSALSIPSCCGMLCCCNLISPFEMQFVHNVFILLLTLTSFFDE